MLHVRTYIWQHQTCHGSNYIEKIVRVRPNKDIDFLPYSKHCILYQLHHNAQDLGDMQTYTRTYMRGQNFTLKG